MSTSDESAATEIAKLSTRTLVRIVRRQTDTMDTPPMVAAWMRKLAFAELERRRNLAKPLRSDDSA